MWSIGCYSSPLLITFLYRKGYIVQESYTAVLKISSTVGLLVAISICIRGIGRSQNEMYRRFVKCIEDSQDDPNNRTLKQKLRKFDFEFKYWPVDFDVQSVEG